MFSCCSWPAVLAAQHAWQAACFIRSTSLYLPCTYVKICRRCISFWLARVACVAATHAIPKLSVDGRCARACALLSLNSFLEWAWGVYRRWDKLSGLLLLLQCNTCPQATQYSSLCIMAKLCQAWQRQSGLVWCALAIVPQPASHCVFDRWQWCRVSGQAPLHRGELLL